MDLLLRNVSLIFESIDHFLEIWISPLQQLLLHQRMHFPESFTSDGDGLESDEPLTDLLLRRDPVQPILHVVLTKLPIHCIDDAVQGIVELNLLHVVVERNLQFCHELTHVATKRSLPGFVVFDVLEVALTVLITENVTAPLSVKGENPILV